VQIANWKLVAAPKGKWQLDDLSEDRAETRDLSSAHPKRVVEMSKVFETWHSN
jgi:hypothetical protein